MTERRQPLLLVEAKLSGDPPSPALRYFHQRLHPAHAVQIVRRGELRKSHGIVVVPADRLLARM